MVYKFPKFSKALAEDPSTRRIWYGIATAHDFESHDAMTESKLYQKNLCIAFRSHCHYFLMDSRKSFPRCLAR